MTKVKKRDINNNKNFNLDNKSAGSLVIFFYYVLLNIYEILIITHNLRTKC